VIEEYVSTSANAATLAQMASSTNSYATLFADFSISRKSTGDFRKTTAADARPHMRD